MKHLILTAGALALAVLLFDLGPAPAAAAGTSPSHIGLAAVGSIPLGSSVHVGGTLSLDSGVSTDGITLHVTRKDGFGPAVSLPDVVTSGMELGFDDTPPHRGTVTYTVTFDGDAVNAPVSASTDVSVAGTGSSLTLAGLPNFIVDGTHITLRAQLAPAVAGATVTFYRADIFGGGAGQRIGSGVTDASGRAVFSYVFTRPSVFSAAFAGDERYEPSQAGLANPTQMEPAITVHVHGSHGTRHGVVRFRYSTKCAVKHTHCPFFLVDVAPQTDVRATIEGRLQLRTRAGWKPLAILEMPPVAVAGDHTFFVLPQVYKPAIRGKTLRVRFYVDGTDFDGPGMAGNISPWLAFTIR
jgi:hypothetical protein